MKYFLHALSDLYHLNEWIRAKKDDKLALLLKFLFSYTLDTALRITLP
jgi:hypothetical protein